MLSWISFCFFVGELAFSWSLRVSPAAVAFFMAIFAAESMISFLRSLRRAFTVLLLPMIYFLHKSVDRSMHKLQKATHGHG